MFTVFMRGVTERGEGCLTRFYMGEETEKDHLSFSSSIVSLI